MLKNNQSRLPYQDMVVGILNWNGEKILDRCLAYVRKNVPPEVTVWVIDNNSADSSLNMVQHKYPGVQILRLAENLGFARAYNLFFQEVVISGNYEYLAILNNDVLVDENWLESLYYTLQKNSAAAVTSLLYAGESTVLQNCGLTLHRWGACDSRYMGVPETDATLQEEKVFGFCGGAVLFSVTALKECGFFDDLYFAYYEDADLSMRFRLEGYEIFFTPYARAWHLHSRSTHDDPARKLFLLEKNRWLFLFKFFPWRRLLYFLGPGMFFMYLHKRKAPLVRKVKKKQQKVLRTMIWAYISALSMLAHIRRIRKKRALNIPSKRKVEDIFKEFAEF